MVHHCTTDGCFARCGASCDTNQEGPFTALGFRGRLTVPRSATAAVSGRIDVGRGYLFAVNPVIGSRRRQWKNVTVIGFQTVGIVLVVDWSPSRKEGIRMSSANSDSIRVRLVRRVRTPESRHPESTRNPFCTQ